MKDARVAAVVATYNRKELLRKCCQALLSQTRPLNEIIVIDGNSTDGTDQMLKQEFPQVTYIRLRENMGSSGHFHEGIKLAYEKGHDWIWIMDDDVVPYKDTLEKLLSEVVGKKAKAIVPKMVNDLQKPYDNSKPSPLFAGGLISRDCVGAVGLPLKEFFIYCDDTEYWWRLNKRKFLVLQSKQALVQHTDWANQPKRLKKILGIKIQRPVYPDWKSYYIIRNHILLHIIHKKIFSALLFATFGAVKEIFACSLTGQYAKVPYIVRGTIDGVFLRKGKRVTPPY